MVVLALSAATRMTYIFAHTLKEVIWGQCSAFKLPMSIDISLFFFAYHHQLTVDLGARSILDMSAKNKIKTYFSHNMPEEKENVGTLTDYCKYKSKCKNIHPKEECRQNCKPKSCMKRHVKQCKFGINCKHKGN